MTAASETLEIVNKRGLHARASAKFVNAVAEMPETLDIKVLKDGNEAQGASILGLMMLGAAKGDHIEIRVCGDGADEALAVLSALIRCGFDED